MRTLTISKEDLQKIYESKSTKEALLELGISHSTYYRLLDEAGIPRKRTGSRRGQNIRISIIE